MLNDMPTTTFEEKLSELKLDTSHPLSKKNVFVVVEGRDDVKLYKKLLNETCVVGHFDAEGKEKLEKGLMDLWKYPLLANLIGIRDADFLHLEGIQPFHPNLFFTDYHDAEMLLVSSDDTLQALFSEYLPKENKPKDVRDFLMNALRFVSYTRWYSIRNKSGFRFKEFPLQVVLNLQKGEIEMEKFIDLLIKLSPDETNVDKIRLIEEIKGLYDAEHDLRQLTNGHDFVGVLALFLKTKTFSINPENLAKSLRLTYHKTEFRLTKLYQKLKDWGLRHQRPIVD